MIAELRDTKVRAFLDLVFLKHRSSARFYFSAQANMHVGSAHSFHPEHPTIPTCNSPSHSFIPRNFAQLLFHLYQSIHFFRQLVKQH